MFKYLIVPLIGVLCFGAGVLVQWVQERHDIRVLKEQNEEVIRQCNMRVHNADQARISYQEAYAVRNVPPERLPTKVPGKSIVYAYLNPYVDDGEKVGIPHLVTTRLAVTVQLDNGEVKLLDISRLVVDGDDVLFMK